MISVGQSKMYCSEDISKIENYDKAVADKEHMWDCHHRGEILPCGIYSISDLKRYGLYYNRPVAELIYLTPSEHMRLHATNRKDSTSKKIGEASSLRRRGMKFPDWWRKKIADSKLEYYKTHEAAGSRPVVMERIDDSLTMRFPNSIRAADWLRGNGWPRACGCNVSRCACGHQKTAYGAIWRHQT